jgi:Transglycosylase SLT domain
MTFRSILFHCRLCPVFLLAFFSTPSLPQSISDFPFTTLSVQANSTGRGYSLTPLPNLPPSSKFDPSFQWLPISQQALSQHLVDTYKIPKNFAVDVVTSAFQAGRLYDLDPLLLLAIIHVESYFNPKAVSSVQAQGLMQVHPPAHREKIAEVGGLAELNQPNVNIKMGARILRDFMGIARGNLRNALQRYNGNLEDEEQRYATKVLNAKANLQKAHHKLLTSVALL